jgi:hypothetical protein
VKITGTRRGRLYNAVVQPEEGSAMGQAMLRFLWKVSRKSFACFAILFVWSLFVGSLEWSPSPAPGLTAIYAFSRLFIDPLILLLVAGWLLQAQTRPDYTTWKPVLRATSRLYLRALVLCLSLVILNGLLSTAFSLEPEHDSNVLMRWRTVSFWLPLSLAKILWLSALIARGRGLLKSAGRAVLLIFRSRLVLAVSAIWALALYVDSAFSLSELQTRSLTLALGWLVVSSALVAVVQRFVYTVVLDQCGALFGIESPDYPPVSETGTESIAVIGTQRSVSLWWVFLSVFPLLSVVAFLQGRSAVRRLRWRSIRAVLAYSFGLFFTLVHLLVLIGASLPGPSARQTDYAFLSQADATVIPQIKLLTTGAFQQAHDELEGRDTKALEASWSRLTARAIAETNLGQMDDALAYFEKASRLKPGRDQFHYLYGRVLLDNGQRSKAEQQLI